MKSTALGLALAGAAFVALPAAPALAQQDVKERAAEIAEQANDVQQQAGELANDIANAQDENEGVGGDTTNGARAAVGDRDGDDDGFDWGILGLLGLAGLLGLRRNNRVDTDIRRDRI
jgi:hypothetical protein